MGSAQGMIQAAQSQLGYKSGYGMNKFNEWYSDVSGNQWYYYHAWCDEFVSWCGAQSGSGNAIGVYAYCPSHVNMFKGQGRWIGRGTDVRPGDIIFFSWDGDAVADHVGIVEWCDGVNVGTIEGNTNAYPGEVARQTYSVWYSCILGYGRPAYDGSPTPTPPTPTGDYNVYYKVQTRESGWLPEVKNLADYAGIQGQTIINIAMRVDRGSMWYQVHSTGGYWMSKVTGYDTNDYWNGFAGDSVPIDCVRAYIFAENADRAIAYRVSPIRQDYFDWQRDDETTGGQDGYAGEMGLSIDRLQAQIVSL